MAKLVKQLIADFVRSGRLFIVHPRDIFSHFMDCYQGYGKRISPLCLLLTGINKAAALRLEPLEPSHLNLCYPLCMR